ncbi:6-phosphogluconolactonase [Durusdinium trenchii]|uniref:6-phosphogluconolactonase n=1 Tax=Durusdinium trenchii TaxID=1381693 RepID=A0ABP0J1A2_9DINO
MRDADMLGKDSITALNLQRLKSLGWARLSLEMWGAVIRLPVNYALKRISGLSEAGAAAKEALGVATSLCQINIDNFISRSRKIPSIIIDEANLALPGMNAGDGSVVARSALQALTKWTKETSQASVILSPQSLGIPSACKLRGYTSGTSATSLSSAKC